MASPKNSSLSTAWWLVKLQFSTSRSYFAWQITYSLYEGISPIITAYLGAKFLADVANLAIKHSAPNIYWWLGLLFLFEILDLILRRIQSIMDERMQQSLELEVEERLFTKMYQLSQAQFDDEVFMTKLGRARDSINQLWRISSDTTWALSAGVRFAGSIIGIIAISPIIGLILAVTIFPISILRARQNKRQDKAFKKMEPYDRATYRSRWMLIDPETMPEVRLVNAFGNLLSTWRKNLIKSHSIKIAMTRQSVKEDLPADLIEPAFSFGTTLYFLTKLASGAMGLDRFLFVRSLLLQASTAAGQLTNSFERIHELTINFHNFNEVYHTDPLIPDGTVLSEAPLEIAFDHVSFSYPGSQMKALDDVSFRLVPGSKLAIVGENGAGKSTIIKILLRQYLPDSGTITVNGHDIRSLEQASYYRCLAILSQNFLTVRHMTIKENLTLGLSRDVSDKEILETAHLVGADSFIAKLKHGLNERLDPSFKDGSGLSGGQLQRLGVARSLLRQSDLMILDEPTSAIDAKAEYDIFNNIYRAHADKTTLIISHRFSTVRKADQIMVMDKGKIVEYGSHEELIAFDGIYKEMFDIQAEGYK